jgi:two-component system, OmpR family, sensor kinase ParS
MRSVVASLSMQVTSFDLWASKFSKNQHPLILQCSKNGGFGSHFYYLNRGFQWQYIGMAKLFLMLWGLVLLTSLLSSKIQESIYDWSYASVAKTNSTERLRRNHVMMEELLGAYPQSQWQERFELLKEKTGSTEYFWGPSRMLSLDELIKEGSIPAEGIDKIRAKEPYVRSDPDNNVYAVYRTVLGTDMVVVLKSSYNMQQPARIFGVLTPLQSTWLIESSLYALTLFIWLRFFRRDMLALEKAAGRVGEGRFDFHVNVNRGAALYPLADSFNKMVDRIGALMGSHKQLTNAISHEFRTPITRLRFRHELAISAETLAEKDRELKAMDSAIDQLDDLSTELLEYARLDREEPVLDIDAIDVAPWLEELMGEANDVAESSKRGVMVSMRADIDSVDGDYRYLSRAAANLLRNAVKYANTRAEISVTKQDGRFVLVVDDDGPGIPQSERDRAFEPFSRLDKSRDRASGGFGIGLAIVQQIARWHGGKASISTADMGGARLRFEWKCTSDS